MWEVEHKNYGKGKIIKKRFGGFEIYVEFEDGIQRWVRKDDVKFLPEGALEKTESSESITSSSKYILSDEQFKAREIIESLRLGIVPYKYVEEFTFGREREIERIVNWLHDSKEGALAIVGKYGAGKTHILEYIYSLALKNNWAVSKVEIDPNEASFHTPNTIYQKITRSFRFKISNDDYGDFREFLRQISFHPDSRSLHDHKYLGIAIKKIKKGEDDEDFWGWIEGEKQSAYRTYPYSMYKHSACGSIYSYILSGIGWSATNILGLNGFLILFDEAEVDIIDPPWYTSYKDDKAWSFLSGIILMANNDERLLNESVEPKFYYSWDTPAYIGNETKLHYCGHLRYLGFVWEIPCHVKIIFNLTEIFEREPLNNIPRIELYHIHKNSLMDISKAIFELYQGAYGLQLNNVQLSHIFDLISKDNTRLFIKGMVEALDLIRFHPSKPLKTLLNLRRR